MTQVRECGSCTECCFTHRVPELKKPLSQWCTECAVGIGCKIYETRPKSCRKYACLWLTGIGADSDRPDKSKAVLDLIENDIFSNRTVLEVLEVTKEASQNPALQGLIRDYLEKGMNVFISTNGQEEGIYVVADGNGLPRIKRRLLQKQKVSTLSTAEYFAKAPA